MDAHKQIEKIKQQMRQRLLWQFFSSPYVLLSLPIFLFWIGAALFGQALIVQDTNHVDMANRFIPPGWNHWMGTDELGRDVFLRVITGARSTLLFTFITASITAPVGILLGVFAGYCGGWIDIIISRLCDATYALPRVILALTVIAVLGPSANSAIFAIALTSWPPYVGVMRAQTLAIRQAEFVIAARLRGSSHLTILWHTIMPLCTPTALIKFCSDLGTIAMMIAGLGFLGLGSQPPSPEWGAMAALGKNYLLEYYWISGMPTFALFSLCFSFNLLGQGVVDVLGGDA